MDPAQDEPTPLMPSPWRAYGRPALARAVASGVAMAGATLPLTAFMSVTVVNMDGETCARTIAFLAVVGAVAGAPGAALETWADDRAGPPRSLVAPLACGLLVPLAFFLLGVQLRYVLGVIAGGVDVGMDRFADVIREALDWPGMLIGVGLGVIVGLAAPVSVLVWLRLRRARVAHQAMIGFFVVAVGGLTNGAVGAFVLFRVSSTGNPLATVLVDHPLLAGTGLASLLAGVLLILVGLATALLLPAALAVADRFRLGWSGASRRSA